MKPRYLLLIIVAVAFSIEVQLYARGPVNAAPYKFSDTSDIPAAVTLSVSPALTRTWAASTADVRALQKLNSSDRIAAAYYSPGFLDIDVNITDGQTHRISFYCLDWDSNARRQTVDVLDYATGVKLDTRSIASFHNGVYLVFDLSGHVIFRFTRTAGADAVVSGIYFGGPRTAPTPTPCVRLPNGKCKK